MVGNPTKFFHVRLQEIYSHGLTCTQFELMVNTIWFNGINNILQLFNTFQISRECQQLNKAAGFKKRKISIAVFSVLIESKQRLFQSTFSLLETTAYHIRDTIIQFSLSQLYQPICTYITCLFLSMVTISLSTFTLIINQCLIIIAMK
jgi:hypothetical protein